MDYDYSLLLNGFIGANPTVDLIILQLMGNTLLKGVPVMLVIWRLWMIPGSDMARRRAGLAGVLAASVIGLALGRILALTLPYSARPIHTPGHDVTLATGLEADVLDGWSSMPSDHAVMYFALGVGILLVHRGWGIAALFHALVLVSLPRIVLGFHWPSDILVGATIGTVTALILVPLLRRVFLEGGLLAWLEARPGLSYPLLFLATQQLATMFDTSRALLSFVKDITLG